MRNVFVTTSNVKVFVDVCRALETREAGVPGLGLVHGKRGLGKTRTALWYVAKNGGIYVRAKKAWTPHWMLEEVAVELGIAPRRTFRELFSEVAAALVENPRLIVIDEVNLPELRCLETLRDVHDITEAPMVFLGHEGVLMRLKRLAPLFDRFLYIAEFKDLGAQDLRLFCEQCLELPVGDEVLERVLKLTGGNFRKCVVVLKGAEVRARAKKAGEISPEHLPREG